MNLEEIGWNQCAYPHSPSRFHGRIALATGNHFVVWTEAGVIEATLSGRLRHDATGQPCVGDWVVLREGNVIAELLPRRTKLVRKQPGKELREQILGANIDALFIVTGLDHDYNPNRLERYLILAYESKSRPILVLNKSDLRTDLDSVLSQTRRHAPGVPVVTLSAYTKQGIEALASYLKPGETGAFIGSSGAGKSTLVNCLLGEDRQSTAKVRDADSKGCHTTTRRELILMPRGTLLAGCLLMDLPGLREIQLWADPEQIDDVFSEISELAQCCRFRDCTHNFEPACAVRDANLPAERLASYHKLRRELTHLEKQTDRQLARNAKNKIKTIEREMRRHPKRVDHL